MNGITLVALVVTIVVLLILAGITLTYVLGDNSVFKQASQAKVQTELGKIEERAQTIYSEKLMQNVSSTLSTKVEASEVIEQLKLEGHTIEKRPVKEGDITGISLDKESMTMGYNQTVEINVTYEGADDPFIYYVEVQGKYYRMHSNKGFITIDREVSTLTKADFENEDAGGGSTATLMITSNPTDIITASLKEESNKIIEVTSTTKEGETIITVAYGSYTKTCIVKVVEPVLATSITLNETEYIVTGGESWTNDLQLKATLEPNNVTEKEVNWKSSNPEIATVDSNGLVKAREKGGDVTITATTKDGTNLSAECKITTELFGKINADKTQYTDSDGNTAQIPDGFAVGTSDNVNKVTGGLVTQDEEGNQFVWIPVGNVKKNNTTAFTVTLGRYKFVKDEAIPELPVQTQDNYTATVNIRPCGSSSCEFQESVNQTGKGMPAIALKEFIDNTIIDKGYWLGRYEASNEAGTKVKYNKKACSNIEQKQASSNAQGLKQSGIYKSDLVNSYAWDTAIVFIEKSGNTGYASQESINTSALNTGKSGDKVCNIYDMASNYFEWNTESCTNQNYPSAYRGGCYDYIPSAYTSMRNRVTSYPTGRLSFRCILYRF